MKKNPFTYLKRASKIKGYRILKPTEKARAGDRFLYLHSLLRSQRQSVSVRRAPAVPDNAAYDGYIRIGRTLVAARVDGIERWGQYDEDTFDGVIYRPIKRKSAKK